MQRIGISKNENIGQRPFVIEMLQILQFKYIGLHREATNSMCL